MNRRRRQEYMLGIRYKKSFLYLLCASLILACLSVAAPEANAAPPIQLLTNPGFEEAVAPDGTIPGWRKGNAAQPTNQFIITNEKKYSETYSFRMIDSSASLWASLETDYTAVTEGDELELSAQVLSAGVNRVQIFMRFWDSGYSQVGSSVVLTSDPAGPDWKAYTATGVVPAGAAYVTIRLDSGGGSITDAYFDDIELNKAAPPDPDPDLDPDNLLTNPGFEAALLPDGTIPGWRKLNATEPSNQYTVTSDRSYAGIKSLRLTDSNNSVWLAMESSFIPMSSGESLETSAMVYNTGDRIQIYLRFFDSGYNLLTQTWVTSNPANNNTWSQYSTTGTAPEHTAYVTIRLDSSSAAVTDAYYDKLSLRKVQLPTITDLGSQVNNVGINAAAYGAGPNGEPWIYTINSTSPAYFVVMNALTGETVTSIEIPGTGGSWGLTPAPDGSVYIGTYSSSSFYRWVPGSTTLINLGRPIASENFLWRLTADEDGYIYGGTYPNGKVFRYDPATNTVRDYGRMGDSIEYTRSIAVLNDKIYAGTGSIKSQIFEVDKNTGDKREIVLPPEYHGESMVYDIVATNDLLLARLTNYDVLLVYSLRSEQWTDVIPTIRGIDVSMASDDGTIYLFKSDGKLYAYDYDHEDDQGTLTATTASHTFGPRSFGWLELNDIAYPGESLVTIDVAGRIFIYNPTTGDSGVVYGQIQGSPSRINIVHTGPDGRIYTGGYQTGGMSYYDPVADESHQFPRGTINQIEGMTNAFGNIYIGVYPGANIFEFDPSEPYNYGVNPRLLFTLKDDGQDRPFALAEAGDRVAVGTVANYGMLEGALTLYDPLTGEHTVHKNLIHNQSITSLQYKDGLLYGSTTVWGGLGIEASEPDAKLFIYDMASDELVWAETPIAGERVISAISFDHEGYLWGVTLNKLFKFDPDTREVLLTKEIVACNWCTGDSPSWHANKIEIGSSGLLLLNVLNQVYTVDPHTLEQKLLASDVYHIGEDRSGSLYYSNITNLFKYDDVQAPPYVVKTSPQDEDTAAPRHQAIVVQLNKPVEAGAAWNNIVLTSGEASVAANISIDGSRLRIEPAAALNAGSEYSLAIPAAAVRDGQGNPLEAPYSFSFTTREADAQSPTWPIDSVLEATDIRDTRVKLSWPDAEDNYEVVQYRIYADEVLKGTVKGSVTAYTVTGLEEETAYNFQVIAMDEAGNASQALTRSATTGPGPDLRSDNARLQSLRVLVQGSELALSPAFAPDKLDYSVSTESTHIEIVAATEDEAASASINGQPVEGGITANLLAGDNKYELVVTAENGENLKYTLVIRRVIPDSGNPSGPYIPATPDEPSEPEEQGEPEDNSESEGGTVSFTDLAGHWAAAAVKQAVGLGIAKGYKDGTFRPDRETTRAEFTALLVRALGLQLSGKDIPYKDVPDSAWYAPELAAAFEAGLVLGLDENRFDPQSEISREQMAVMLFRAFVRLTGQTSDASGALDRFIDADRIATWAQDDINQVLAIGLMQGKGNGVFDPKAHTSRAEAIQAILNLLENL
ncbi:hypothetical protein B1748_20925 [Paenibacillus sp. MY03]|uniref:S-layer homology domain-containing protein n=1 Tax=Paenibacillus sp. MY03 TaxID=302980 RepID=UPI000B3CE64E|nr:S-layer homology domain-containing protein [Paenibacillus sp. MY03]OUS74806.1 hypothetical protein B1748_20925 [Paenibacillus sp. MY03]